MPELTSEDRRKGLDAANRITELAADMPDLFLEKLLHRAAQQARQRYGYSPRLKKQEIVRLARVTNGGGGVTMAELIELTGWHKDEVYDLTKELENEKPPRLEFRRVAAIGRGRPSILIIAREISNFSPPQTINRR